MTSKNTFKEEYASLSGIPGVFHRTEEGPDVLPGSYYGNVRCRDYGSESITASGDYDRDEVRIESLDLGVIAAPQGGLDIDIWLEEELGIDIERLGGSWINDPDDQTRIAAATATLGSEALGQYLPWHIFGQSVRNPWGIYLTLDNLLPWAGILQSAAVKRGITITDREAIRLAFMVAYRHEMFHFHVERFATRQEVLQRKPIYLPYDKNVYQGVAGTADWLEEALAQAVVLESRFIKNRLGIPPVELQMILRAEFLRFGPGYRDFGCQAFGGPEEAHRILAAQIVTQQVRPAFRATSFAVPKVEYQADHKMVPGYLVWRPRFVARFQLAMPEYQATKSWMARSGFTKVGPGPGDHEIWKLDSSGQKVHLNRKAKETDIASIKAVAHLLGWSLGTLTRKIRADN